MSITPEGQDDLKDFERGSAIEVPVAQIESSLQKLWREAAESAGAGRPQPVTRACLWNLIVRVGPELELATAKRLIDEVAFQIPARMIVLLPESAASTGEAGTIRAWVKANWRTSGGRARPTGSDEVILAAQGKAIERLPSLVRSLITPDAPTAMLWMGAPEMNAPARELIGEIDRLIVDTRKLGQESAMAGLNEIASQDEELELADLAWLGISPLRGLTASLFDPTSAIEGACPISDPGDLANIERAVVISGVRGTQARSLLALGWLASRLGWSQFVRETSAAGIRIWHALKPSGEPIILELSTVSGPGLPDHGVVGIALKTAEKHWTLDRDQHCIRVSGSGLPSRVQPARSHSDADLVVVALGGRGRDPIYRGALQKAVELVKA